MKELMEYNKVRNDALKLADKMFRDDHFVPDVIYASLRGGAYMANVISEYYKLAVKEKSILYAAVIARSYTDVNKSGAVHIDGWTYSPEYLRAGDKVLLVDDIFDTGRTINFLVNVLLDKGLPRESIKVCVHDYKHVTYKDTLPVSPDYYCRKIDVNSPSDDIWINYNSHELVGLSAEEREKVFYEKDPEMRKILEPLFKN